ncbi:DUF4168 domain-containing protein [Novosphingobium resinovorum]|uniref:DUF4168 domain-containing protein n=1 Tax=Novosphingobium resinovorum TaxID=158500 RepID=UPI002ED07182|nr:DUF4168 domain-containing protein [Novosphingobium resinovorum]
MPARSQALKRSGRFSSFLQLECRFTPFTAPRVHEGVGKALLLHDLLMASLGGENEIMLTKSVMPVATSCALYLLATTGAARAQDAVSPGAPPPAAPATPPVPGEAGGFSDAELEQYVKAALAVQEIQQDTATPDGDKQARMVTAVKAAGLTPEKFNQIATDSQSNPALQQRIQAFASKLNGGSPPQ